MNRSFLNPYLFFIIKEGHIICWDYKNHEQYEIQKKHFNSLLKVSENIEQPFSETYRELKECKLLIPRIKEENWGWDCLSKIFHIGTQIPKDSISSTQTPEEFSYKYLQLSEETLPSSPSLFAEREGEKIILPAPNYNDLEKFSLITALKERKTCRSFNKGDIALEKVSTLLSAVFGNIRSDHEEYKRYGYEQIGLRKSSPSGGGLHATEAYLLALHIEDLCKGIYHYQSQNHVLTLIQKIDLSAKLPALFCGQYFAQDLSLGIFLTSKFSKLWHEYPHSRAYRIALLDVGHISQTFQLVATALNLNPWLTGAFIDKEIAEYLQLKDNTEQPLFFVGAGLGPKSALDPATKKLAASRQV